MNKAVAFIFMTLALWAHAARADICDSHVPELSAIDCSKMSPTLMAFCYTYQPHLMDHGKCRKAEAMSQAKVMTNPSAIATSVTGSIVGGTGNCYGETFLQGSGSFSYVYACNQLGTATTPTRSMTSLRGTPTSPQSTPLTSPNWLGGSSGR